jgi:uncharacterized protein YndB with AHSA1/START domain
LAIADTLRPHVAWLNYHLRRMSRSHENEIEIDAPPAVVWRALSEGEELERWFAVAAEVEPGEGGCWKVSWDESPVAALGRIGVWQPDRHLRLVNEGERAEDFELIALDGGARTRLRLVASGFDSSASSDVEFECTKNGWAVFLRNLRHYLEHFRGQRCRTLGFPFAGLTIGATEAFDRMFGVGGVLPIGEPIEEGRRVTIATSFGTTLHATIDFARPAALLGLVVDGVGLLRAEFVGSLGLFVHVMLLAHGEPQQAALDAVAKPLSEALASALGRGTS